MSDPMEKLNRFGADLGTETQGAPMPLSASEVRRLGDQRRRRGTALRSGVAALAIAAIALPIALTAGHGGSTPGATTDPHQVMGGVGEINVLTDAQTTYSSDYHWQQTASLAGDGDAMPTPCAQQTLSGLGATSAYHRDWQLADSNGPLSGPATVDRLAETVGQYDSIQAARGVVEKLAQQIATCDLPDSQHYTANRPQNIDTGNPDDMAMLIETNYLAKPYRDEDGRFIQVGLVQSGDRVAVLDLQVAGQDFNVSPAPVAAMLPDAAHRLVATTSDPSPSAGASSVEESQLVRASDVTYQAGMSWKQTYSGIGDVQAQFSICAQRPLNAIGAGTVVQRNFTATSDETGEMADAYLMETIGDFGSPQAAGTAITTLRDWYTRCTPQGSDHYALLDPWERLDAPAGVTAQHVIAQYGPAEAAPGTQFDVGHRKDLSWYADVSLVQDGSRVAVLVQNALMVDYDTTYITSTDDDVDVAIQRMRGQAPNPTSATERPSAGSLGGVPTSIPATFPLDAGWEDKQPEGPDSLGPAKAGSAPVVLGTGCASQPFAWPAHVDQMGAYFHNPEDNTDRMLVTFRDADAAVAATKAIVDAYRACPSAPSQPAGYVTHYSVARSSTSGDSWEISQWDTDNGNPALGTQAIHVIRVGLAVLVLSVGGEGDHDSMPDYFTALNHDAAQPIAAMCTFTEAGC
ncbi:hypothetical protein [Nocardioides montaniterrae]